MADVIVVGGGVVGLCASLLLARDGHRVVVVERDPAPPPSSPDEAWTGWERRGVNQFRMLHAFLPRFREVLAAELPDVIPALVAVGALQTNRITALPESLTGGARPGDERFATVTGRRPIVEATLARVAAGEPGVEIRRGAAVKALLTGDAAHSGIPRVTGVVLHDGSERRADLVVDAGGRRSCLPGWLAAIGARPPHEEREDRGFIYYGRHFRSPDGSVPPLLGPPLQPYDSISLVMLAADNGTWGVGIVASAADTAMRAARRVDVWERVVKSYPLVAHWVSDETISDVDVMAKIEDCRRSYWRDGEPVATGVVAVGDASACTNPSLGRGASIGLLHAVCLRDAVRSVPATKSYELVEHFEALTSAVVLPLVGDTMAFDRHRLAEIEAQIAGVPYETSDPAWRFAQALRHGAARDPDLLRASATIAGLLERGVDVLGWPGLAEKAMALGTPAPAPGPTRAELVELLAS